MNFKFLSIILFLVTLGFSNLYITSDTTISGVFEVKDSSVIFDTCNVTIMAGTVFKADSGLQIIFRNCNISAIGTETDSIKFTSYDSTRIGGNVSIYSNPDSIKTITFRNTIFEKMGKINAWNYYGLSISSKDIDFSDCVIRDCEANVALGISFGATVKNCLIKDNKDGVYLSDSCKIINCDINDNYGEGISVRGINTEVRDCRIRNSINSGIEITKSNGIIKNNLIYGTTGAAINIDTFEDSISVTIDSCVIDSNYSKYEGAGIRIKDFERGNLVISNCSLSRNESERQGGALYLVGSAKYTIVNCSFTGNKAWKRGSDIYAENCDSLFILNSNFSENDGYVSAVSVITDTVMSKYNLLKGNTFTKCDNSAIDFEGINPIYIDSCTFISNYGDYCDIKANGAPYLNNITWSDSTLGYKNTNLGTTIIKSDEVWSGDVSLPDEGVYVEPGVKLTISGGTNVLAPDYNSGLAVGGTLIAEGSASDSIIFTVDTSVNRGSWNGISLVQGPKREETSRMKYVSVSQGRKEMGGGIYVGKLVDFALSNSSITDNDSYDYRSLGGGICIDDAPAIIDSCYIANNMSDTREKNGFSYGFGAKGAGIYASNTTSEKALVISNCIIRDNEARSDWYSARGAGVYIQGDRDKNFVQLRDCRVVGNKAKVTDSYMGDDAYGGGVYATEAIIEHVFIDSNSSLGQTGSAAGIKANRSKINRCFIGDYSRLSGDETIFANSIFTHTINFSEGTGIFTNNTSSNNTLYIHKSADLKVYNSIVQGNITCDTTSTIGLYNCLVSDTSIYKGSNGNISGTVLFEDSENGNFQLVEGSAGIDAGIADTTGIGVGPADYLSHARIFGSAIDIGAYEYGSTEIVAKGSKSVAVNKMDRFKMRLIGGSNLQLTLPTNMLKQRVDFRLFNMKGQVVFKSVKSASDTHKTIGLNLNEMARGMYILNVSSKVNVLNRKVIIR